MAVAFDFAFESAGNSIDAKMAIIAITTNNSISVNAAFLLADEHRIEFITIASLHPRLFIETETTTIVRYSQAHASECYGAHRASVTS